MRTETVVRELFTFDELSEDAKQKAIDSNRCISTCDEWWDGVDMDAENIGLKITSFDLDRNRHATGDFLLSATEVAANIIRDHGDMCDTFKTATDFLSEHSRLFEIYSDERENENGEWEALRDAEDDLCTCETEFLNDLLECYSGMLQREWDYLNSDDAIIEAIQSNGCEFTKSGNPA
jgi:hypothetical protein